jgi:hypothetical protein
MGGSLPRRFEKSTISLGKQAQCSRKTLVDTIFSFSLIFIITLMFKIKGLISGKENFPTETQVKMDIPVRHQ